MRKEYSVAPPKGWFDADAKVEDWLNNETVNEIRDRERPLELDELDPSTSLVPPGTALVLKAPFKLESGALYCGEWMTTENGDKRAGTGVQVWKDGSIYEG